MEYLHIKTLYIEVTHACNQHCRHCYLDGGIHNTIANMSTEQIKKIFREFKDQGGRYIILTGGEPIIRKDIFEILDYIEELEIPFNFASNSLAMTKERLEKLSSYKYLDMYFTSILGVNADKHKAITGKDSFDKVLEALAFFDKKKIPTYVQVTLADEYIDDMESIAELLTKFDNCTVKFTPIGTLGIKSEDEVIHNQYLIVPKERFKYFHDKVTLLQEKYPNKIEDSNIQDYSQIYASIDDYKDEELYSMCYGFLAVRPNGDMSFSCNMDNPFVFGKAYESIKIPVDKKLKDYIDLLRKAEEAVLKEAEESIVELDVTVDKYINILSGQ
jgi:MoaA/NifB/PqqE/SkfB family radical SAM enzyme